MKKIKKCFKNLMKSKRGEGYVDTGVKILIAVVIGALLLSCMYALLKNTVMDSVKTRVEGLFEYSGGSPGGGSGGSGSGGSAQEDEGLISFYIGEIGPIQCEDGMTWYDFSKSTYNSGDKEVLSQLKNGWMGMDKNGAGSAVVNGDGGTVNLNGVAVRANELVLNDTHYTVG